MPYIKQEERNMLDSGHMGNTPGQLNYLITNICLDYLAVVGEDYASLNDVVGALECAKLEFYRRMVVPYEDRKCEENGDIYE